MASGLPVAPACFKSSINQNGRYHILVVPVSFFQRCVSPIIPAVRLQLARTLTALHELWRVSLFVATEWYSCVLTHVTSWSLNHRQIGKPLIPHYCKPREVADDYRYCMGRSIDSRWNAHPGLCQNVPVAQAE